jgi:hypothetical protein
MQKGVNDGRGADGDAHTSKRRRMNTTGATGVGFAVPTTIQPPPASLVSSSSTTSLGGTNTGDAATSTAHLHGAGFDSHATGFVFACYADALSSSGSGSQSGQGLLSCAELLPLANLIYLIGKDIPLRLVRTRF